MGLNGILSGFKDLQGIKMYTLWQLDNFAMLKCAYYLQSKIMMIGPNVAEVTSAMYK